ncbi:hypothetical protein [Haloferax denitrificans]|uniref:hypothetical protein n=1 Tax=Haloferax denitrificans TaxID=35745 RepID=UPI003C6EDE39
MKVEFPDVDAHVERLVTEEDRRPFIDTFEQTLEDIEEDEVRDNIETEVYNKFQHTNLVTAVASGFSSNDSASGSKSNFKFHSTDPLIEKKPTGADVLLARDEFNRVHFAVVFCEIGDENLGDWVENVNEAHELFEKQSSQDDLLDELDSAGKAVGKIEYIIAARSDDLSGHRPSDIARECNPDRLAIWSHKHEELCHEYGDKIHKSLKDVAIGCFDFRVSETPIQYTVESAPFIPLQVVIFNLIRIKKVVKDDDHPLEFNNSEFRDEYERNLQIGCLDPDRDRIVSESVADVIELGKDIGILSEQDTNTVRDYRVMFPGNTDDPLEAEDQVKQKYINRVTEARMEKLAFEAAQDEFPSVQSDLGRFDSNGN